jgi:hypothetical protein
MATKKKTDHPALPNDYELVTDGGGDAVLARNFFPDRSANQLTSQWALLTLKFRPFFRHDAFDKETGRVDTNHSTAVPTTENLNHWIGEVKNQVIGKKFRDRMRMGWNTGLADLMEVPSSAGGLPMLPRRLHRPPPQLRWIFPSGGKGRHAREMW